MGENGVSVGWRVLGEVLVVLGGSLLLAVLFGLTLAGSR
jgi:hypothetical protein